MNILIIPNSFRGSLNTFEIADIMEKAFVSVSNDFNVIKLPVSDGGDHTLQTLLSVLGGEIKYTKVLNPLQKLIEAPFGITPENIGIIEMACASGTKLLKHGELNPTTTTTYGTGQLIKTLLGYDCKKIIIGIGGSATIDAGVGMLQALGISFKDKSNNEIEFGGGNIGKIVNIDISNFDKRIYDCEIKVACDVDNVLTGNNGAAKVFGSQKGGSPEEIKILDKNLEHFATITEKLLNKQIANIKFGGAAGGIAASLYAFCDAKLVNGTDYILDKINFQKHLKWADIVITAEGKIDKQTKRGKAPYGIAVRAKKEGKPVIAFAGQIFDNSTEIFNGAYSFINKPMDLKTAFSETKNLLFSSVKQIAKTIFTISKL
ncbi:MAG: glycerate kinase [Bacteroidales bacterium]|nr:glycerate kinase [Bacteroidales bacterium]